MTPIQKLLSLIIPVKRKSDYNRRFDPPSNNEPDIDAVSNAITSAESGNMRPFVQLVKQMLSADGHIQTETAKRKLALLGDPMTMLPASKSAVDVAAAKYCKAWADDYSGFTDAMLWALDGQVWPQSTSEKHFVPGTNGRRFDLELSPVDPALWDYTEGDFRIQDVAGDGSPTGSATLPDPAQYWTYRGHLSTLSDQRGGPARPLLFLHFMSHCSWHWWGRFLERFGAPFMVGKVDNMDSDETDRLEAAFSQATRVFGVVVSRNTELELLEGKATDGSRAYEASMQWCQREKSKIILGQYGTTEGVASGLNGDTASKLDKVRGEFRAWDNFRLGASLRSNVLRQFMRVNGIPGSPPTPFWGDIGADQNAVAGDLLVNLAKIGILPAEGAVETLSQAVGIPLRWAPADSPRTDRGELDAEIIRQMSADPFPWTLLRRN
jgi:phage gp29-like protein